MSGLLRRLAARTPDVIGSPWAFVIALGVTILWLAVGPSVGFGDSWLLVPSAVASVVTFLIVFLLQYSQNRDTRAIQLKLDEVLRAVSGARTELVKLEHLSDEDLTRIEDELLRLREEEKDG